VAKNTVGVALHNQAWVNDGAYGNGSSWIAGAANAWVKLDLGRTSLVEGIRIGRDRTAKYDDRDPGQFQVWVAQSDVYAAGDEASDAAEYVKVFDSSTEAFSGNILGAETLTVRFPQVSARFVKLVVASGAAAIDEVEVFGQAGVGFGSAAAPTGVATCRPGASEIACTARPFDTSSDLAWSGNGYAKPAVAQDTIVDAPVHVPENINDGAYGNGASWIGGSAGAWVKIDLGRAVSVTRLRFGRDRVGTFDDRDPGQFEVWLAEADAVYAAGDDTGDEREYSPAFLSAAHTFTGTLTGPENVVVDFPATTARYVKFRALEGGAAIDEVEVFGTPVTP